jgi:hypothetical protein
VAAAVLGAPAAETTDAALLTGLRLVAAEARSGNLQAPEHAIDGDPKSEFSFEWGNGGATLVLDLGGPRVLERVRVTNGQSDLLTWLTEISVGPDAAHFRPLLGRPVNLPMWRPGDATDVPLAGAVARYVKVQFGGGGPRGSIGEVALFGRENRPERHLMCWSESIQADFLDKLDYFQYDLGVTDLWLDFVESAFPQTNRNAGFAAWAERGAFERFRERGIRYWLAEHEAFTFLVQSPEDLRDDRRWETTFRQARTLYAQARALGFRGLVLDAEDYDGVTDAARQRYAESADYVDAWCFADEFGPAGMYYLRGRQFGQVLEEVWGAPLLQVYEARLYAGKGDCRAGNYWWLRGIHDAGIEVWLATEKTYGAGQGEIGTDAPVHLRTWFVQMPEFMSRIHEAYPFAARVLPGFHPWNTRTRQPNYLPRYLAEQVETAANWAAGYWLYTEGNAHGGDPRQVLDPEFLEARGLTAEQYLEVLRPARP